MCVPNNIDMYVQLNWLIELQLYVKIHHEKFSVTVFCHAVFYRFNFQTVMHRCTNLMAKGERLWLKKSRREGSPASTDPVKSCWLIKVYGWYLQLCSKTFFVQFEQQDIFGLYDFWVSQAESLQFEFPKLPTPLLPSPRLQASIPTGRAFFMYQVRGTALYHRMADTKSWPSNQHHWLWLKLNAFPIQRKNLENSVTCAASMQMMIIYTWASLHYNLGSSITVSEQELLDFYNVKIQCVGSKCPRLYRNYKEAEWINHLSSWQGLQPGNHK